MKKTVKSRLIATHGGTVLVLRKLGVPLRYTLPGGTRKRKETPLETLIREVGEEITLDLGQGKFSFLGCHSAKRKRPKLLKHYFLIELEPRPIGVLERDKFERAQWVDWREALPFMDQMDRTAVRTLLKGSGIKTKKSYGDKIPPCLAV